MAIDVIKVKERDTLTPPIKDIKRWPAIMFAVSRKVSATGRIKLLNVSTKTINLIKNIGVPEGIK